MDYSPCMDLLDRQLVSGEVAVRPFTVSAQQALLAGWDEAARRSPEPAPVASIDVGSTVVGWVDYDDDRQWLSEHEVNVGYEVFPEPRGNGYGSCALRLICDYLDSRTPKLHPTLLIDPSNAASLAVAVRVGFEQVSAVDRQLLFRIPVTDRPHL